MKQPHGIALGRRLAAVGCGLLLLSGTAATSLTREGEGSSGAVVGPGGGSFTISSSAAPRRADRASTVRELIGMGDDTHSPALTDLSVLFVIPGSVTVWTEDGQCVTDDGGGGWIGAATGGSIDYVTGRVSITWAARVPSGARVAARYNEATAACLGSQPPTDIEDVPSELTGFCWAGPVQFDIRARQGDPPLTQTIVGSGDLLLREYGNVPPSWPVPSGSIGLDVARIGASFTHRVSNCSVTPGSVDAPALRHVGNGAILPDSSGSASYFFFAVFFEGQSTLSCSGQSSPFGSVVSVSAGNHVMAPFANGYQYSDSSRFLQNGDTAMRGSNAYSGPGVEAGDWMDASWSWDLQRQRCSDVPTPRGQATDSLVRSVGASTNTVSSGRSNALPLDSLLIAGVNVPYLMNYRSTSVAAVSAALVEHRRLTLYDLDLRSNPGFGLDSLGVALSGYLRQFPTDTVSLVVHTDPTMGEVVDRATTEAVAGALFSYLVAYGVNPARIATTAAGTGDSIAFNTSEQGRALNRRIEVVIR